MQFDRRAVENRCEEGRRERLNRGSDAEKEEEEKKNCHVCQQQLFECRRAPLRYNKAAVFGESFV